MLRLGDKEVEYNPDFRFYITTKLSNPHYTPEISTKTLIVNFAVKEQGMRHECGLKILEDMYLAFSPRVVFRDSLVIRFLNFYKIPHLTNK